MLSMISRDALQLVLSIAVFAAAMQYVKINSVEPGSLPGHALGIIGTLLMFGFLLAYSTRKRTAKVKQISASALREAHVFLFFKLLAGKILERKSIKGLLEMHIFMGLLGPSLVAAHTSLRFNGIAGMSTLLMFIVVLSGFLGRYIHRRIPDDALEAQLRELEKSKESALKGAAEEEVERLEKEIQELREKLAAIKRAKELLSNWKVVHIPLTTLFFITVLLHVIGVLYYR